MKIAVINPSMCLAGGVERVISIQVNTWVEKYNHDVIIITQADPSCSSFYKLNEHIRIIYTGDLIHYNILDDIRGIRMFRKRKQRINQYKNIIKREAPNIIISMMQGEENFFLHKISNNIPIIGVNHLTIKWRKGILEKKLTKRISMYITYCNHLSHWKKYDAIVALSKTDRDNLHKSGCKTYYIPNPCSFPIIKEETHERKKQVVMIGRLDYLKGQDQLLKIWKQVSNKFPEWTLLFVGDGEAKQRLLKIEKEYGIENSIRHIYKSDNIQSILTSSSILAFTSRLESFGMVILEAFCCGLPVISYDCENGPRDLVISNKNGFLIPEGNEELFINLLTSLMNNANLRKELGINAKITADVYNIDNVMNQWETLLKLLTKNQING